MPLPSLFKRCLGQLRYSLSPAQRCCQGLHELFSRLFGAHLQRHACCPLVSSTSEFLRDRVHKSTTSAARGKARLPSRNWRATTTNGCSPMMPEPNQEPCDLQAAWSELVDDVVAGIDFDSGRAEQLFEGWAAPHTICSRM